MMADMTGSTSTAGVTRLTQHIKSRARVRDLGEVYTQPREIDDMLALVPDAFRDIDTRFLEPAAGNGNFLVAILERKVALIVEEIHGGTDCWFEFALLRALASVYGVDISSENVEEARDRMTSVIEAARACRAEPASSGFSRALATILSTNVVVGDSLNAPNEIVLVEYSPRDEERFARQVCHLENPALDLFYEPPAPLSTIHYSELGTR